MKRGTHMQKTLKLFIALLYGIGTVTVAVLLIVFLSHSGTIPFPDAMLPSRLWELSSMWLADGFIPMLLASIGFYRVFHISGSSKEAESNIQEGTEKNKRRRSTVLVFLPAAVCFCFLAFWILVWGTGFVTTLWRMR